MSCFRTPEILADYFDKSLSGPARDQLQQHLADCAACQAEVATLEPVGTHLRSWQREAVPEWNRTEAMNPMGVRHPTRAARKPLHRVSRWWNAWPQWAPLAASMVLAVAVLTQTTVSVSDTGWTLSFGEPAPELQLAGLDAYLARHAEYQQEINQQMLDAALLQFGESTAENLYQVVTWFEQQREIDLRRMEAGFQQVLDRDYQTVSSMQQLASFVQFQGELR